MEKRESQTMHARFKQLHLEKNLELDMFKQTFSYNDQYYRLPEYFSFILNHPVHETPDDGLAE
jgi:hypothetical protein